MSVNRDYPAGAAHRQQQVSGGRHDANGTSPPLRRLSPIKIFSIFSLKYKIIQFHFFGSRPPSKYFRKKYPLIGAKYILHVAICTVV
jgi:hypothetical protein